MNRLSAPNILAFINLGLGIISTIMCFKNNILLSSLCILGAAFLCRYGQKAAGKADGTGIFDRELNLLSDMVSFGTAPAILTWNFSLSGLGLFGYALLLIFPICAACSLSRAGITEARNEYTGMPAAAAGSLAALDTLTLMRLSPHTGISALLVILLSYLMASNIKFKKYN